MAIAPDLAYQRSREDILNYEDARFLSLLSGVPDYYYPRNDTTVWGSLLRATAMEIARLDVMYAYDLVSINPAYLNPADARRQLTDILSVNKNYPQTNQFDRDYRDMLAALMAAYQQGVTPAAIEAVVLAYTGQAVVVEELFRLIGNGVYDASDRNTIQVTVDLSETLSGGATASEIQTLSQTLYGAIQLAAPAHIGVRYIIAFGNTEVLTGVILGITDTMSLEYDGAELQAYGPDFTFAPMLNASSPNTGLTAIGKSVGEFMAATITATQYAALLSDAFRAEYGVNPDGTYTLLPGAQNDIILTDTSGNPTGAISQAQGELVPVEDFVWQIQSDELDIFELD